MKPELHTDRRIEIADITNKPTPSPKEKKKIRKRKERTASFVPVHIVEPN